MFLLLMVKFEASIEHPQSRNPF